jgi:hypothetical protein
MSYLHDIISLTNIRLYGVNPGTWTQDDQSLLTESMILACKENPDWSKEQAQEKCKSLVQEILFLKFKKVYKYAMKKQSRWTTLDQAFRAYLQMGESEFEKEFEDELLFQEFCEEFYDYLREKYNACSAVMYEEFNRMKKNNWSMAEYRVHLYTPKKNFKN